MQNRRHCYLCRRETGDEIRVCGMLNRCCRCHGHDWWCLCGHGHGDRGRGHHGLLMLVLVLVLGHDRGHGHSQGWQVGHWWRGELTEDFHIHCWEATLKQRIQLVISTVLLSLLTTPVKRQKLRRNVHGKNTLKPFFKTNIGLWEKMAPIRSQRASEEVSINNEMERYILLVLVFSWSWKKHRTPTYSRRGSFTVDFLLLQVANKMQFLISLTVCQDPLATLNLSYLMPTCIH